MGVLVGTFEIIWFVWAENGTLSIDLFHILKFLILSSVALLFFFKGCPPYGLLLSFYFFADLVVFFVDLLRD